MGKKTVTIVKSDNEIKAEEQQAVAQIKPKLEKFLIDTQVNKAAETAYKTRQEAEEMIINMSKEQADVQASRLAMKAFLDLKLWETHRPPLEFAWVTGQTVDGRKISEAEGKQELAHDISGFSSYLVREYFTMKDEIIKGNYLNPMVEANIQWFWDKFCSDIKLLLDTDMRLQQMGNKSVLSANENE